MGGLIPYGFSEVDGDLMQEAISRINAVINDYKHHSLSFDPVTQASDTVPLLGDTSLYELANCVGYRMSTARGISLTSEQLKQIRVSANKITTAMSVETNLPNERYFSYRNSGLTTTYSTSVKPVLDNIVEDAKQRKEDEEDDA